MTFSLRPASQLHIPIIQSLSEEIWREYYPSLISLEQIEYMLVMMYSVVTLRKELQEGRVYLYVNKGNSPAIFTEIGDGFVMDDWVYRLIRHLK